MGGSSSKRAFISSISIKSIMFEKYLLELKLLYKFKKIAFPLGILVYPWIIKNNPTLQNLKSTPFLLKKDKS